MVSKETINKAQEAINDVLADLLLLEKDKNRIIEKYAETDDEELKKRIELEMEISKKKYQELYEKAQVLSAKIKDLKKKNINN